MDALSAISSRRSTKQYTGDPVPREILQRLVEAAYCSPSGANKNPWQSIVVTDRGLLDRLAEAHPYCGWLKSAQAAIVIAADSAKSRYWLEDCCAAAENIWIAATALGLGAAWAAMYMSDNPEETARREGVARETLGIPDSLRVPLILGLGKPATQPGDRKRPPLTEIVHWGKWGA
ncbi:MAG: nitroreductase family protein [Dehalococcoidia bacterium]|nr:nitroreductase family protein [Dehalococcoidia bacterium]